MDSSDEEQVSFVKSKKRINKIDSDDESSPEDVGNDDPKTSKAESAERNKIESSDDDSQSVNEDEKSIKPKKQRKAAFADSDESSEDEANNVQRKPASKSNAKSDASSSDSEREDAKDNSASGSESEGEINEEEEMARIEEESKKNPKPKAKKRQDRKSKDAAMKEIYSESQRMFRESGLSLSYHRPKQRTLDEFLNRRKKQLISEVISDIKIRKPPQNHEEVQKRLEECEKFTEEFYKNEEDEDKIEDTNAPEENANDNDVGTKDDLPEESSRVDEQGISTEYTSENQNNSNSENAEHEVPQDDEPNAPPIETNLTDLVTNQGSQESCGQGVNDSGIVPNVQLTDESASNSDEETLKKVLTNNQSEDEASKVEEDSMKLFLEPDTEKMTDDDEVIPNSQKNEVDQTISEKRSKLMSKKLEYLGKTYDLSSQLLSKKPTLGKAMVGEIILEDDEDKEKEDAFLKRLVKHANASSALPSKAGRKKKVDITVVRKELDSKGHEKLKSETIQYKVDLSDVSKAKNTEKPGAQLLALKKTLQDKILEKKKREWEAKKQQIADENEEGFADGEEEEEEFEEDDDEVEDEESSEGESEPPESDEDNYIKSEKKFKRVKSAFLDDEAEEEDNVPKDDEEETMHLTLEEDDGNEQNKENEVFRTPSLAATGGRTQSKLPNPQTPFSDLMSNDLDAIPRLTPFEDRSDNNEPKSPVNSDAVRKKLGFESLFDTSDPQVSEIDDVIGLCSGQFFTQKPALSTEGSSQDSQEDLATAATPDTVILQPQSLKTDSQLFACTQTSEFESNDMMPPSSISVIRSDDEDDQTMESLTQVAKKKAKKLVLSDDESDTEEAEIAQNEEESDIEKDDNAENKEVMYDSEENEVEVPKFKGFIGKKGIRKEYLENEAELSGSEIGSDDEDERGLDKMLQEEGDLDDLDEEEVRDEVGRIHHRQVLDEDKREIRLFQEAFLEDGELHSDKTRERKFRWKNVDDDNYDHSLRKSDSEGEEESSELDEKRRLERLEREKWIQDNQAKEKTTQNEEEGHGSKFFDLGSKALRRINSRKSCQIENKSAKDNKVLKSPQSKMPLQVLSGNKKGSFLSREDETLEKLAEMTKNKSESKTGATAKNTNNFVFAAKSPSKVHEGKSELIEPKSKASKAKSNASHKQGPPQKKPRVNRVLDENSSNTIFGQIK